MGNITVLFDHKRATQGQLGRAVARLPSMKPQLCAVLSSSREGACLASVAPMPDWFLLRELDNRVERMCRVVWRFERLAGVEYVNARSMGRSAKRSLAPNQGKCRA